ncbi:MAG: Cys-tRNA(Pro) deacylase [Butyrivibrio sp.]
MAKNKDIKTNAMRILEKEKIPYEARFYECDEFIDGVHTADLLGIPHEIVYKTIVTVGHSGNYFVFVIPIEKEIDFKKAAKSVGEKSVELLPLKDVTNVTGYIRGGCTAIGMKKQYITRIDSSAKTLPLMVVSGGKIGVQLSLKPQDLSRAAKGEFADVTK